MSQASDALELYDPGSLLGVTTGQFLLKRSKRMSRPKQVEWDAFDGYVVQESRVSELQC